LEHAFSSPTDSHGTESEPHRPRHMIAVALHEGGIAPHNAEDVPMLMGLMMMPTLVAHPFVVLHHMHHAAAAANEPEKRTAPPSLVDHLPCRTSPGGSVERECAVCLSQFEAGDRVRTLPCQHEFHSSCIDRWLLEMNRTCPCCRLDLCEHASQQHAASASAGEGARSDLDILSVRELKEILHARGIDSSDCVEKSDLVDKVRALMH
jgi:hypothetical protein